MGESEMKAARADPLEESTGRNAKVGAELIAMRTIAAALASLHDDEARGRVLQWACTLDPGPSGAKVSTQKAETEAQPVASAPAVPAAPRVDPALAVDLESFFENARPSDEADPPADRPAEQSIVSMVHGFVKDFQKLAREWDCKGATPAILPGTPESASSTIQGTVEVSPEADRRR